MIGMKYIDGCGLLDWPAKKRILVPITRHGRLISWVARSYSGAKPKTFAPAGAPKKWELIGFDQFNRSHRTVNVCEGWVDRIRLMQIGRSNACALCGSKMSEYQAEALIFAERIIIWQDGDKAGEVMAEDLAAWLGRGRELLIVPTPSGKDPGTFSPSELSEFQPITWSEYQTQRRK
jgi:DNA primase